MKNYEKTDHPAFWSQYFWGHTTYDPHDVAIREQFLKDYDIDTEYVMTSEDLDNLPVGLGKYFEWFKTKSKKNIFLISTNKELKGLEKLDLNERKKNYYIRSYI